MDISYEGKGNHDTIHKFSEAKKQEGSKGGYMDLPEKGKWGRFPGCVEGQVGMLMGLGLGMEEVSIGKDDW